MARFQREAQAASALNHPHILNIYEVGCVDARDYIAMELVAGETLRDRIARDRDLPSMLDILVQVGDALARAHEADTVFDLGEALERRVRDRTIAAVRSAQSSVM